MTEDPRGHIVRVYEEGALARRSGKTHLDNPHANDTPDYVTWFMGWAGRLIPAGHP